VRLNLFVLRAPVFSVLKDPSLCLCVSVVNTGSAHLLCHYPLTPSTIH